ncbi:MAG: stalk domain-containing protein [Syntrophomonadaceae bacterium]|nr:stalk domain-containing protein [Syntrophomonadaceae bacterium]MDD3890643.1 stalk domain-containing protein [Syntrophomonadaceae bacterium]MDD4550062.1 stalk domain-containing protein [Syntrophomonadaceae bacterium]
MNRNRFIAGLAVLVFLLVSGLVLLNPYEAEADQGIRIYLNGREVKSDVQPLIINDRTMVPIRVISEGLGLQVKWDNDNRQVIITGNAVPTNSNLDSGSGSANLDPYLSIIGKSVVDSKYLKTVLRNNNADIPESIVDLYLQIGEEYGIRGDIAFCQAAKETGWWRFTGLVKPYQNNYCGLAATGAAATGEEDLRGADSARVRFEEGVHGAIFDSPATGVEAHIQHLYAYVTTNSLPQGKNLVDPRFVLVKRGIATTWSDLDGRWAVPGNGYGYSILNNYYRQALILSNPDTSFATPVSRVDQLEKENQLLKQEIEQLRQELN